MPVKKVMKNGKVGYRWGESGKIYTGKDAKSKAAAQGRAVEAQKHRKSTIIKVKKSKK